jgi:hypothetical protein
MQEDLYLDRASEQVRENAGRLVVKAFFDEPTFTVSYVVHDPSTQAVQCAYPTVGSDLTMLKVGNNSYLTGAMHVE